MKDESSLIALAAAMLFVFIQHRGKKLLLRMSISGASGGMGYGVAPELAVRLDIIGEATAMVIVTALIYAILDLTFSVTADKRSALEFIRAWRGR